MTKTDLKRAVLYSRVSSVSQIDGYSLDAQERKRRKAQEKLRRLGKAYVDGVYDDDAYRHQKRQLGLELESLVVPQADAAEEAGRLIEQMPDLWAGATMGERRRLLTTMMDAVYVDAKGEKRIVAIKPKAPFKPIFQVATMREGSGISLLIDKREITPASIEAMNADRPPHDTGAEAGQPCSWWRRGREPVSEHSARVSWRTESANRLPSIEWFGWSCCRLLTDQGGRWQGVGCGTKNVANIENGDH